MFNVTENNESWKKLITITDRILDFGISDSFHLITSHVWDAVKKWVNVRPCHIKRGHLSRTMKVEMLIFPERTLFFKLDTGFWFDMGLHVPRYSWFSVWFLFQLSSLWAGMCVIIVRKGKICKDFSDWRRLTRPKLGMFVHIWMHYTCWIQMAMKIWSS